MKLIDLLEFSALGEPQRPAVKNAHMQLSYSRLLADVRALAAQLKSVRCRAGTKVALILGNSAEYLVGFFAVSAAGGAILPLSAGMTLYEIAAFIDRADASIVITSEKYARRLQGRLPQPCNVTVISVRYNCRAKLKIGIGGLAYRAATPGHDDIALMVPTSGTTGQPKIVMLTDNELISNMAVYRLVMGFQGNDIVYCSIAMHHIYCICAQVLTHISLGDTFITHEGPFFIKDFFDAVQSHGVSVTAFVPYMAILLARYPCPGQFNLNSLRYVTLSGAKTPASTYKLLTDKYPHIDFINTYGMSEAGSRISIAAPFYERFPIDSVGKPMPGVSVRIVDEHNRDLPANSQGEILLRSPGIMNGYYKQPALTGETINDGWLKTGDIGKLDEQGNLFIIGRTKDLIVTGGENISPVEIEDCLMEHPAIRDAAVVGKKDDLMQEVPCAFVVKNERCVKCSTADILKFCKVRLSSHKVPRCVVFLNKLPRLGSSKIDRNALRKKADNMGRPVGRHLP